MANNPKGRLQLVRARKAEMLNKFALVDIIYAPLKPDNHPPLSISLMINIIKMSYNPSMYLPRNVGMFYTNCQKACGNIRKVMTTY